MKPATFAHPGPEELAAFAVGRLPPQRLAEIEEHVAACDDCCLQLRSAPDDTLVDRLRKPTLGDASWVADAAETVDLGGAKNRLPARLVSGDKVPKELAEHPRYRVVRVLGAGGMGVVYQAEHRLMERPVALKVISRQLTSNPLAVQRFRQEVKNAARLNHPNIVTAHDAEQAGDLHFLVMEYVEGINLAQYVERFGPLPVHHACNFARQAALGLQHAAEKNMVHRDIKPQNLMLTRSGKYHIVKILDFGLARFAREQDPASPGTETTGLGSLTAVGSALGTPDYMAPEQIADSRQATSQSDIYALGGTLYFLLAGRPPFPDGSTLDKLAAHLDKPPPPLADLRANIPAAVVKIVERMMAKDPAERFATAGELAQALLPFCKSSPTPQADAPLPSDGLVDLAPETHATTTVTSTADDALDLREVDLAALPDPLPPLPGGLDKAPPTRIAASRPFSPFERISPVVRRHRTAIAAVGVGIMALLLACLLFPRIQSALVDGGHSGEDPFQPVGAPAAVSTSRPSRVLIVIPHRNFWYGDYHNLTRALTFLSMEFDVASSSMAPAQPAPDDRGFTQPVTPTLLFDDADPADYDAVIFSGGAPANEMEFLREEQQRRAAREFMMRMLEQQKFVIGICAGNAILADAGVLYDRPAAANQYVPQEVIEQSGAHWDWETNVVSAGSILTARDEFAAKELIVALSQRLTTP